MDVVKASLVCFSLLFWLAGLATLSLGLWARLALSLYLEELTTGDYSSAPYVLLAAGAAVTAWGFLGCFSAATGNPRLLRVYGLFQVAVLVAGLAAGLSGLFYRRDIAEGFRHGLARALRLYGDDDAKSAAMDGLQRALDCCGVDGFQDWLPAPWSRGRLNNGSVPESCCVRRRGCRSDPVIGIALACKTPTARGTTPADGTQRTKEVQGAEDGGVENDGGATSCPGSARHPLETWPGRPHLKQVMGAFHGEETTSCFHPTSVLAR
ncbi:unnamed protein product [Lampetra planeri]